MKAKRTQQREVGRIKLTHTQELVASLVDGEKLDLRLWVDSSSWKGWTKQGCDDLTKFWKHIIY